MTTTTHAVRRLPARPRMNVREHGDAESWHCSATMRLRDLPALPEGECTAPCGRTPCDHCWAYEKWEQKVLDIVAEATGWQLSETPLSAYSPTGRPFCNRAHAYQLRKHPGVVRVTWSGGLDI